MSPFVIPTARLDLVLQTPEEVLAWVESLPPDVLIDLAHRGRGFATEATGALAGFAFASGRVRLVRAHTKPDNGASARVLVKCGFRQVGEVIDPEDGLVCRWEQSQAERADAA
jgi:RimJ/RimL family protein N-acetyltransferase